MKTCTLTKDVQYIIVQMMFRKTSLYESVNVVKYIFDKINILKKDPKYLQITGMHNTMHNFHFFTFSSKSHKYIFLTIFNPSILMINWMDTVLTSH